MVCLLCEATCHSSMSTQLCVTADKIEFALKTHEIDSLLFDIVKFLLQVSIFNMLYDPLYGIP